MKRERAVLFALLCLITPRALGAHVIQLEPREVAAAAPHVAVATIEGLELGWAEH